MPATQDFRFALRTFGRSPGITATIVLILAIGIGANTAMFTLVNDILLKPLPSPEGGRITQDVVRQGRLRELIAREPVLQRAVEELDLELLD